MCLPKGILSQLKTFSPRHRRYIALVLKEIIAHYDTSLVGLAIFGSYARRENRLKKFINALQEFLF